MGRPKKVRDSIVDEPARGKYTIAVSFGEKTFRGTGDTMLAALEHIEVPLKVKTKAMVVVTNVDRVYKESLMPIRAKRIFHKIARISLAKNYELLLK